MIFQRNLATRRLEANRKKWEFAGDMHACGRYLHFKAYWSIRHIFGILVIVFPDLLQWIVGQYFIIQGLLFFADYFELRKG
ncbi:hypothetical protein ES702_06932 [subsurface metagenome]